MKNLRYRIKSYLERTFIVNNHDLVLHEISQKATLHDLPSELLLEIYNFLPLVDLNCFAPLQLPNAQAIPGVLQQNPLLSRVLESYHC